MWSINNNADKQINIKEKFFERYTLYQHSFITMGSLVIDTKNECRWDVRVLEITENYYKIELLTLDNVLTATNNNNIKDLSLLNNTFKKMYNELELLVDHKGALIKVLNVDHVKKKWQQVKSEMQAIQDQHPSINGMIALNDDIFSTNEKITEAVRSNEFFGIFFNCFFGVAIPGYSTVKKKSLFMQSEIDWKYELQSNPILPASGKLLTVNLTGTPLQNIDKDWLTKAYGSFPIITATDLKPKFIDNATYTIENNTGKILKASIQKEEIAHEQLLYARVLYDLVADNYKQDENKQQKPQPGNTEPRVFDPSKSILFN